MSAIAVHSTTNPNLLRPSDEAQVAAQHAAAMHAVATVLAMSQGRARRLLVEEVEHTDWSKEVGSIFADLVVSAFVQTTDSIAQDGTVQHTLLVALDEHGNRVGTLHAMGWYGRSLWPAVVRWSREAGAVSSWLRKSKPLMLVDGRYVLASPPPARDLGVLARALAQEGWVMTPTERGFNATRAVYGRDWPAVVLIVVIGTLLFPITALVLAYMLVKKLSTGRWPVQDNVLHPMQKAEDRVSLDCAPGRLRVVRAMGGKTVFDHTYDRGTLQSVYTDRWSTNVPTLTLVEGDRVTSVAMTLRGEVKKPEVEVESSAALAEAIVSVWSKPM